MTHRSERRLVRRPASPSSFLLLAHQIFLPIFFLLLSSSLSVESLLISTGPLSALLLPEGATTTDATAVA
jgi:hypothetical protein